MTRRSSNDNIQPVQSRPNWIFAQTPIPANAPFRLAFVGIASNGGYAIDDIKLYPGTCSSMYYALI